MQRPPRGTGQRSSIRARTAFCLSDAGAVCPLPELRSHLLAWYSYTNNAQTDSPYINWGFHMPMSGYLEQLRKKVGHNLLLLPSAAVAILDREKGLLLCKHADKDIWVTPGGLIEPGEHPADAAVRETWEETGLTVEITGVLGVYGGPDLIVDYPNGDQ